MATKQQRLEVVLARAKEEILAGEHFHTAEGLAQLQGKKTIEFKLLLEETKARGDIFSIELQGRAFYPDYAFSDDADATLLTSMGQLIRVLKPTRGGWGIAFWFRSPNNFLGGRRPEDVLLQQSQKVLAAALQEVSETMHG